MRWRPRLTRFFLWFCVLTGGICLGAKLFDLRVLVGAWSASPPESLSLLPYGAKYPVDTGEFFQPLGAALLVGLLGAAISGWKTPASYRVWLLIPFVMVLAGWILTVLWFWPLNGALWAVARGAPDAVQDRAEIVRMTRQWVTCDWLRVAILTVSFVSSVRAISVPYAAPADGTTSGS
jgi:hypothetical protein